MPELPKILKQSWLDPSSMFKVEQLELEFSNGQQRRYQRLNSKGLGAVIIVPMINDEEVLLIREYACGLHCYELGLPKGRLEVGESSEQGANRELMEEAGFGAKKLEVINHLTLAPTYMSHATDVVLAQDLYPQKLQGDEPEEIEVVRWPIQNLDELASRADVTEGRTIAALYLARDFLQREA